MHLGVLRSRKVVALIQPSTCGWWSTIVAVVEWRQNFVGVLPYYVPQTFKGQASGVNASWPVLCSLHAGAKQVPYKCQTSAVQVPRPRPSILVFGTVPIQWSIRQDCSNGHDAFSWLTSPLIVGLVWSLHTPHRNSRRVASDRTQGERC